MSRMLRDWLVAILVGVGVFFAVDWLSGRSRGTGDPAPAFELADAKGGTRTLAEYAGKTVVLNFWGSWCPPCRAEVPELASWSARNPDVPILGIAVNSGAGLSLQHDADRIGITWPVLEADDDVVSDYAVSVFPTTVVVDGAGVVRARVHGAIDAGDLDELVAAAN